MSRRASDKIFKGLQITAATTIITRGAIDVFNAWKDDKSSNSNNNSGNNNTGNDKNTDKNKSNKTSDKNSSNSNNNNLGNTSGVNKK